jgi:hypothetical protein
MHPINLADHEPEERFCLGIISCSLCSARHDYRRPFARSATDHVQAASLGQPVKPQLSRSAQMARPFNDRIATSFHVSFELDLLKRIRLDKRLPS